MNRRAFLRSAISSVAVVTVGVLTTAQAAADPRQKMPLHPAASPDEVEWIPFQMCVGGELVEVLMPVSKDRPR